MENCIKDIKNIELSYTISAITGKKTIKSDIKPIDVCEQMIVNFDASNGVENNSTERIWAYLKLQQLSKQKLIYHNDMIEMDDDEEKEEESLGLKLGLKYKFVTPWTSMIVVKKKDDNDQGTMEHEYSSPKEELNEPILSPPSSVDVDCCYFDELMRDKILMSNHI